MKFNPSPQVPALQYVGNVEEGGSADLAGLKTGDFIIEVNIWLSPFETGHVTIVNIRNQVSIHFGMLAMSPLLCILVHYV